jgi:isopenicillin-N N-acyltransferase-like protein
LIEVWGDPRQRGVRYGAGASREIGRGVDEYLRHIERQGIGPAALEELVAAYLPIIAHFDNAYVEEMRGIAEGAGQAFANIVLLNARTELLKLASRPELRGLLARDDLKDGCTTIVVQPERATDGMLLHAHNWDWKAACAESCVILRVRQDSGPDYLTFTEAGALGRFGFNSAGIAVTGNYLECERDYRQAGVPLALLRRKVLEQVAPALAFKEVYTTPKSGSNNLAISHAPSGVVHDLECAPDETFVIEPQDGLLVHTNHWQSPVALSKLRDTGVPDAPCSHFRLQRVRRLLGEGKLSPERVREVLADTEGAPWGICYAPRPSNMTGISATVATILMQPSNGAMEVSMMPALGGAFTRYALASEGALADA